MTIKVLIYLAAIMFAAVMPSSAATDQPLSAQELIETTKLSKHRAQLENGQIVLIKRGRLESKNQLHIAMKSGFKLFILMCVVLLLSACAGLTSKFVPQVKENVGVFADTTLTLLSSLELAFDRNEAVYIREFFYREGPDEKELLANKKALAASIKSIVRYSLQLVIITETHKREQERVTAYADYLAKADPAVVEKGGFTMARYFELVEEIRGQDKFQDALIKAQPIISAMNHHVNSVLDQKQAVTESLAEKMETRIDEEYAQVIQYKELPSQLIGAGTKAVF